MKKRVLRAGRAFARWHAAQGTLLPGHIALGSLGTSWSLGSQSGRFAGSRQGCQKSCQSPGTDALPLCFWVPGWACGLEVVAVLASQPRATVLRPQSAGRAAWRGAAAPVG